MSEETRCEHEWRGYDCQNCGMSFEDYTDEVLRATIAERDAFKSEIVDLKTERDELNNKVIFVTGLHNTQVERANKLAQQVEKHQVAIINIIKESKDCYPDSIFPDESSSIDCRSARFARKLLESLIRQIEALKEGEK